MRYTILGFSQKEAMELKLDVNDLLILRWFVDFYHSGSMIKMTANQKEYAWVNYSKVLEDIPILSMKKTALSRRLAKICDAGILEHETLKQGGTYSLYRLTSKYEELISSPKEKSNTSKDQSNEHESGGVVLKSTTVELKSSRGCDSKVAGGATQKYEQNINLLNDSSIKKNKDIYIAVLDDLNNRAGTHYKYNTPTTTKLIDARLKEGFTKEDFFTVIQKKCNDWIGTDYEKYLRPQTLFGTKFENYLNERTTTKAKKKEWDPNNWSFMDLDI